MPFRLPISLLLLVAALAAAGLACSDGDNAAEAPSRSQTSDDSASNSDGTSLGSVVPNTFLTFEGRRYRLVDVLQADLADDAEFDEVGRASEADIEGDLTVYRRDGDQDSVCRPVHA